MVMRAKVKLLEEIDGEPCCDLARANHRRFERMTFEITGVTEMQPWICHGCGGSGEILCFQTEESDFPWLPVESVVVVYDQTYLV